MAKSFRQKNVSKKLKRNIRGGDKKSSAAKKIQRLFRKGQSKKNKSAKKIQNMVRQVQSKSKKNKSAKKIQSAYRAFSFRKSVKKNHPDFKEKWDRECGICLESIKPGDKLEQCLNKHIFHTDCISGWCSAAISNGRQSRENPNIWQTKCPLCRDFMNCPGSRDDIVSRQRQNREREREEQFQVFRQQELAAQNRGQPARVEQRLAEQQNVEDVLDAINAAEAHIIANIAEDIREYNRLTRPRCLRYIEVDLEDYISITYDIELDTYINSRSVRIAKDAAKVRIVNEIAKYCVRNILIPQMQRESHTAEQGQSHDMVEIYTRNISRGVERWWHLRNQEMLEVAIRVFKDIFGEAVVLADERDRLENDRQIGAFNFGDVDNMFLYNLLNINEDDVEADEDVDDLIDSFGRNNNAGSYDMNYRELFDDNEQINVYNGQQGTDAERREIIDKIGTRILKSRGRGEYSSYIDMNDDLGTTNVYICTDRNDASRLIDRIWAIYGPGGVYSANNNGRALLRSREEVNNPRSRSRSRSR
tara:strand:+ start:3842 stop:5437 length:1596 start_codon:yes stop_codon:yes gene_type:complete